MTMATIQIELPDETAKIAQEAGFLTTGMIAMLIEDAIERRKLSSEPLPFPAIMDAAGVPPMSLDEISAEVKAVRTKRRRAGGR